MLGFKEIPEYPEYLISRQGEVYSTKVNRLLSIRTQSAGYFYFSVNYQEEQTNILLHRALARVYLSGLKDLHDTTLEVDHKDRDKTNCKLDNLQVLSKVVHKKKTILERGHKPIEGNICHNCGKTTPRLNKTRLCQKCITITKDRPLLDQIVAEVLLQGWKAAAPLLGYASDNGLRKRYISLGGDANALTSQRRTMLA